MLTRCCCAFAVRPANRDTSRKYADSGTFRTSAGRSCSGIRGIINHGSHRNRNNDLNRSLFRQTQALDRIFICESADRRTFNNLANRLYALHPPKHPVAILIVSRLFPDSTRHERHPLNTKPLPMSEMGFPLLDSVYLENNLFHSVLTIGGFIFCL